MATGNCLVTRILKGVVHFQNEHFLIIYSPPRHPRYSCLSFFSRKDIKVIEQTFQFFFHVLDFNGSIFGGKSTYICIFLRKWWIFSLDKTPFPQLGLCRALWSCTENAIWTINPLSAIEVHYMEKNPEMFSSKNIISLRLKKDMNILDDMGVSKLFGNTTKNIFFCVQWSFWTTWVNDEIIFHIFWVNSSGSLKAQKTICYWVVVLFFT